MEITSIEVDGLIGRYSHKIHFSRDDDFVILHGPNGVGKTMLLELVKAASELKAGRLMSLPFDQARIGYDDGTMLQLTRHTQEVLPFEEFEGNGARVRPTTGDTSVEFTLLRDRKTVAEWRANIADSGQRLSRNHRMETYLPVRRIGPRQWYDTEEGDTISWTEVLDRYNDSLPAEFFGARMPEELRTFRSEVNVHLIETQRLVVLQRAGVKARSEHVQLSTKVAEFAQDLKERLGAALAENSRISQERDRTYPLRLLQHTWTETPSDEKIRERYSSQSQLREQLAQISLLDEKTGGISLPPKMETWQRRVMWTYLEDSEIKLETFVPLLEKINLLREIVNSRFLSKRMVIDRRAGISFVTDEGRELDSTMLSSGEQHELVLLYDLLFSVPMGALVLIDEPEISLHVNWQKRFLDDIRRISKISGFRFIVATHSPQIIGKWWDRAIALDPRFNSEGDRA
ncbi:AAA family ATPase [Streptomyces sp. ST2-7A]|uniref:AAA family ATPase n=1 Tax=Streptomyces sp. ST2-7A TaxID=2907214 RepID=UPI001F1AB6A6|nr:AAA family ATPase [Streptomyces sp. ST2-7A]MCE7079002.1 AAA family ATPase [Streptomyces sp. ST2-7A]